MLLAEQKRFPREKLCGEFISPECRSHFEELGVGDAMAAAGGIDLRETIFFARNGKGVAVNSSWFGNADTLALGLSRAEMDALLLERAKAVGVDVREEIAATGLTIENEKVVGISLKDKTGRESTISAKLTIDASGRTRSLARRVDMI